MKRAAQAAAVLCILWPAFLCAAPSVRITSPAPGDCVSAGRPGQPSQAGADPPVLPTDVTVVADVAESTGAPLDLVLSVDGVEVLREVYVPARAGVAEAVSLSIAAQSIDDGPARVFRLEAESLGVTVASEATARVDRRPPRVVFTPAALANVGQCLAVEPAAPAFTVEDAQDALPVGAGAWVTRGCQMRYEVTARDHCGAQPNTALVTYGLRRPPPVAPTVTFSGVAEAEVTLRAVVNYVVNAGEGCVEGVNATVQRGQDPPGPLVDGTVVSDPGPYIASVSVDPVCSDQSITALRRFTVVEGARADAGGPYRTAQDVMITLDATASAAPPQSGGIVSYDWDLDNDSFYDLPDAGPRVPFVQSVQGVYQVWVRVTTANGERFFDDATVTVSDPTPLCDAGGPYAVEQGTPVLFDATATRAGSIDEPILAYGWDFGDDRFPQQGDGLTQPSHRYSTEGSYTVTLTVQDIDSICVDTASVTVRDVAPTIRNLHIVQDDVPEGEPVVASAGQTSAGSAAEPLLDFSWSWGGGPAEVGVELRSSTHIFPDSGVYPVCLTVRDVDSRVSECVDVTVLDLAPLAVLTGPGFALEGETVEFDADGSRAGGAADPLSEFRWDFGDGTPVEVRTPDETRIAHSFTAAGTLTVRLTVSDEDSDAEASRDIIVEDAEPLADLSAPAQGVEGLPVRFDASASIGGAASDPIVRYEWDFGDGDTSDGADMATVSHAFPDDGVYLVAVTVIDADGSRARRDSIVRISNLPPTDVRIVRTGVGTPEVGRPVALAVESVDVAADSPRATWSFGDGGHVEGPVEVEHAYAAPGRYRVVVSVDDGDGGIVTAELFVQVERPGPEITGPVEGTVAEGATYTAQIDVRPAPDGSGGFDAPVTVRVPLAPPGASVQILDVGANPTVRRVLIRFTPGFAQEGPHSIHVDARSPTGLHRVHDLSVNVMDVATPVLIGVQSLSGTQGEVSVFSWRRQAVSRVTAFERLGRTPLGEPPGDLLAGAGGRYAYVGLGRSGRVAVVDLVDGTVVRRIPVRGDGQSPTLFALGGGTWVLGAENALARLDEARLKLGSARILQAPERLIQFEQVGDPVDGDLVALGSSGRSLYLWVIADVVAERAQAPRIVPLPFRISTMAWDASENRLLLADAKASRLHDLDAGALVGSPPVVSEVVVELPGVATRIVAGSGEGAPWIATRAGLVRLVGDEASLYVSRFWSGLAVLPANLLGEESLALGTSAAVEIQRVTDGATLEVWAGNGATRLQATLRR